MILIICGVSGAGKTTIGKVLAEKLNWRFVDADDYHPAANVEKMRAGIPLEESDREPWLGRLAEVVAAARARGDNLVLACSALRRSHRRRLGIDQDTVKSVWLRGSAELIAKRLGNREHAFMPPGLLDSQFDALEPPEEGIVVGIDASMDAICDQVISQLGLKGT